MKLSKFLYTALVSLSSYVAAAEGSDVTDLTESTEAFNKFIGENPLVLAKFFTTWCGHCKRLGPEFQLAATELKDKDIKLVEIDCDQNQALCAEHKVEGYPTLFVFKSLDSKSPYEGGRTADEIVKYMTKELLPSSVKVTPETVDEFKAQDDTSVIGFFNDKDSNTTFSAIADASHHKYNLGYSNDLEFAKTLGATSLPAIVVLSKDGPSIVYDKETAGEGFDFSQENLNLQIIRAGIAPAGEIAPETFRDYMSAKLPLGYLFYETPEQREEYAKVLLDVAKEYKSVLNIGFIDAKTFGTHATNVNLKETFPAFSIHNMESNRKYPVSQEEPITPEQVATFVKDFVAGKIEPTVKSDPLPESQDGPVYTVVGHNYEEIVFDDNKDVLIEFYAPWCGHCKKLAPTYDELGALYFDNPEYKDKVSVAKVDHTANEIEIPIQGYPTIMLFPAGKKDSPITYQGARTLEALTEFIKENGTHKIDGAAVKKAAPKKSKRSKKAKGSKKAKKATEEKDEL